MDYNINFKYKSGGGTASSGMGAVAGMRQKAIQASTKQGASGTLRPDDSARKLIDTNIKLSTNILKLNQSVTMLTAAMKNNRGMIGGGVVGGGGHGGSGLDSSAGFGGMGSSIPIAGAAIALTGFVIKKVNQIGNAYISKTSEQAKSVGVGGFRSGQGMYGATEMGAGMHSFGMASGKFSQRETPNAAAIQSGNIFGLSASETLGQAGTFQRAGADYSKALYTGAGAGMETELPKLMQALAGTLEEAVKNGVNTSDLSKDLGEDMVALTMSTTTKSVDAAMKVAQSAGGSKTKAATGQMENIEDLFVWRGAEEDLMSSLNDTTVDPKTGLTEKQKKLQYLEERKYINPLQKAELEKQKKIGASELVKVGGEELLNTAIQDTVTNMSDVSAAKKIESGYRSIDSNMSVNRMEILSNALGGMGKNLRTVSIAKDKDYSMSALSGKNKLDEFEKNEVLDKAPALGVSFQNTKDNDLFTYGHSFAQTTIEMDTAMRTLAKNGMDAATTGITEMGEAATKIRTSFSELSTEIDKIKKQGFGNFLKSMIWD